jgi:hypothetical protein
LRPPASGRRIAAVNPTTQVVSALTAIE